jgi:hypothetical protein
VVAIDAAAEGLRSRRDAEVAKKLAGRPGVVAASGADLGGSSKY